MNDKKDKYYEKRNAEIKKKREERKKQMLEGREEERRLWFVTTILKKKGIKLCEVAKSLGISPANLSHVFTVQDDCLLDRVEQILDFAGIKHRLYFDYSHPRKETPAKKTAFGFRGNVEIYNQPDFPNFITACSEKSRLRFLAEFIMDTYKSYSDFLNTVGMYYSTMKTFFDQDNIKISRLCTISEKTGVELIWDLNE